MFLTSNVAGRLALAYSRVEEEPVPLDRRVHRRQTLSELEWLSSVRLKYGPLVTLIDLSAGGAQIETSNYRLLPGSTVVVQIAGADREVAVPSQVLRCFVSGVMPQATYRSGLSFKRAFEPPQTATVGTSDSLTSLMRDHARIIAVLRQRSSSSIGFATQGGYGLTHPGETALASALAVITSASGHRAGPRFRRQLAFVFQALAREIETGSDPEAMLLGLTERLRRSVPARTIRVVDAGTAPGVYGPHTAYFDVAARNDSTARLVVEFAANAALEEWHMQFLQAAAQLVTVINDVAHMQTFATVRERSSRRVSLA